MSKKAKTKRKKRYKAFMDSMVKYRETFVEKKLKLIEKLLSDESLKSSLLSKNRKELNKLERAALDTIISRDIQNLDQFNEIKDKIKDANVKRAKFKYKPKAI